MAHYTLPGVMHYLQTEFTKNERDRITWELERAEMRARIIELENENKDLKYKLVSIQNGEAESRSSQEKADKSKENNATGLAPLIKSKQAVQDNVKEIVYLLKSPNANDQIESLKNKSNTTYQVSRMALNSSSDYSNGLSNQASTKSPGQVKLDNKGRKNELDAEDQSDERVKFELEEVSDADTVLPSDESDTEHSSKKKPAKVASLFKSDVPPANRSVTRLPENVKNMKVYKNMILMNTDKNDMILVDVLKDNKLSNPRRFVLNGLTEDLLDYFIVGESQIMTIDESGLKLWELGKPDCISHISIFKDGHIKHINYEDIIRVDFKNKWLLFATKENVVIIEVVITKSSSPSHLSINKKHIVETYKSIVDVVLGMTEKSFITICGPPYELNIYNFQGEILHTVSLEKHMAGTMLLRDEYAKTSFQLNKESAKLLIQINNIILVYSFDQKIIVLKRLLKNIPASIMFKSSNDVVILAYSPKRIEYRTLARFDYIQKVISNEGEGTAEEVEDLSLVNESYGHQISARACPMDIITLNKKMMLLTAGDTGLLSLDQLVNSK